MKPSKRRAKRARQRVSHSRDREESSFSPILFDFIARVPGASGAVLVDFDGEAVDYAGRVDPFDLKLSGAHWQIVLRQLVGLSKSFNLGAPRALAVRGSRRSFIAHTLPDGYALVLVLGRRAGFTAATRAFAVCERALASEAGWARPVADRATTWFALHVVPTRAGRPARIRDGGEEYRLEVVGRVTGLAHRESGWRVRLPHGAELTVVREPGGHWYGDEHVQSLFPPSRRSP